MKNNSIVFIILFCTLFACKNTPKPVEVNEHKEQKHWSYEGETDPAHWAELEDDSDCSGTSQSPINIIDDETIVLGENESDLKFLYHSETKITNVKNNGHSIEIGFEKGDSIHYKNDIFHLKQIHFHEPSEHTINGIRYPVEMHFVHFNEKGEITVVGIFGQQGTESEYYDFLEKILPLKVGESKAYNKSMALTKLFPETHDYYTYSGSLTTPPCTENVNWIVIKNPITISEDHLLQVEENMPLNNYRNVQKLNGRKVYKTIK